MTRVDVIMELGQDPYLDDDFKNRKPKRNQDKQIKIDHELFEMALQEGLIEKTSDGYVFVGKHEDIKQLKKKK